MVATLLPAQAVAAEESATEPTVLAKFDFDTEAVDGVYTGTGATATITGGTGAVVTTEDKIVGDGALSLGSSTYLDLKGTTEGTGIVDGQEAITISYWSKPTGGAGWAYFVAPNADRPDADEDKENYLGILDKASGITVERYAAGRVNAANAGSRTGEWAKIDIVYAKDSTIAYVNGEAVSTQSAVTSIDDSVGANGIFWIGKAAWGNEFFEGLIDDFTVYSGALTAEQITANYEANKPAEVVIEPAALLPIAEYDFNNGIGEGAKAVVTGLGAYEGEVVFDTGCTGAETDKAVKLGDYGIELSEKNIGSDYSVSFWVKADGSINTNSAVIALGYHAPEKWLAISGNSNSANCKVWTKEEGTEYNWTTIGTMNITTDWSFITMAQSGNDLRVYQDGNLVVSGKASDIMNSETGGILLGVNNWDAEFTGLIDDVAVYDKALSDNDAKFAYLVETDAAAALAGAKLILAEAVKGAAEIDRTVYTAESLAVLDAAVTAANAEIANEAATAETIEAAATALEEAALGLVRTLRSYAVLTASYASGTTLENLRDGVSGAGTWSFWNGWGDASLSTENNSQWVMYDFDDKAVDLTGVVVNWYDDGGGVVVPTSIKIEYDKDGEWTEVTPTGEYAFVKDENNAYGFEAITTTKIRMTMTNTAYNSASCGAAIYEWDLVGAFAEGVDPNAANKVTLKTTIETAKAQVEADYTAKSWAKLLDAIAAAEAVVANTEATQEMVDAEVVALTTAIDRLIRKDAPIRDYATVSASYDFTTWGETLSKINDGDETTFWNGWGDESLTDGNVSQWVMYDFDDEKVELTATTVKWYDDNGGVKVPTSIKIEYDNEGTWTEVTPVGEYTYVANDWNTYEFEKVTTTKIRMTMTNEAYNSACGASIYEWDVVGYLEGTAPVGPIEVNVKGTIGNAGNQADNTQHAMIAGYGDKTETGNDVVAPFIDGKASGGSMFGSARIGVVQFTLPTDVAFDDNKVATVTLHLAEANNVDESRGQYTSIALYQTANPDTVTVSDATTYAALDYTKPIWSDVTVTKTGSANTELSNYIMNFDVTEAVKQAYADGKTNVVFRAQVPVAGVWVWNETAEDATLVPELTIADKVVVDKAALEAAIAEAEALTEADYTAETWAVFAEKLEIGRAHV